jgi:hypothetical protein
MAVQYFANMLGLASKPFSTVQLGRCPNNSTLLLMMVAEAYNATRDSIYLEHCPGLVNFLIAAQLPDGKLPYIVADKDNPGKDYYLCFQYNAFQFLDLARYHELTGDERIKPVLAGLARFLENGLTADGSSKFDSFHDRPFIPYYTAVLGAALLRATQLGFHDYTSLYHRVYDRVLAIQRSDGSFTFSHYDYRILSDRRSYPRNQAMILKHLLMRAQHENREEHQRAASMQETTSLPGAEKTISGEI